MNKHMQARPTVEELIENLHRKRREVLSLPAEKALDEILSHPQPAAMVHSFTDEDFYFLVHDIGTEDSLELLSLASDQQWEYLVDAEVWEGDRISPESLTKWLYRLLKADPDRLIRWVVEEKIELAQFHMFRNMEVLVREHDQDPSDFQGDFFTLDDVFYIRFLDRSYGNEEEDMEERDAFLSEFLNRLAALDHVLYQQLLLECPTVIPAELEEESYRLRNVRLAEKGFMPFEEAVGIYQPLEANVLGKQIKKLVSRDEELRSGIPVPLYPGEMLKEDNLFTRALGAPEISETLLRQLQSEFAGLCNQVISADGKKIRGRTELKQVVRKVCGYLSIGLESLTEKEEAGTAPSLAAAMVRKIPLSHIFRTGYGLALELKWKAEKWQKNSWFAQVGLPLTFWGEEWLGVVGGLLIKKPLFFDNYETGVIYREFTSIEDIGKTEKALGEIIAFDGLLASMNLPYTKVPGSLLTYKNFVLTFWARHRLGLSRELVPIGLDDFRAFFRELWAANEEKPRKTDIAMKESFLNWVSEQSGRALYDLSQTFGKTFETLFRELESEYGEVPEAYLDPRYVNLFLVGK